MYGVTGGHEGTPGVTVDKKDKVAPAIKRRKLDEYLDKAFSIGCGSKIDRLMLQGVLRHGILMA